MARNPAVMQEMMRNQDRALSNLEVANFSPCYICVSPGLQLKTTNLVLLLISCLKSFNKSEYCVSCHVLSTRILKSYKYAGTTKLKRKICNMRRH